MSYKKAARKIWQPFGIYVEFISINHEYYCSKGIHLYMEKHLA
ncbi:hypothetical protein SAMD00020551_3578 [Mesobacillus selenatarsenatis SF-1]|uniref:Uncharacterized protein n=1 Tax=Mesobacillus selenatarsenatis (strain DSM 18680 / JCM 14380 / FERM P-15431 / SF-1) TaxID=1321606 RepID=A0A0A8XBB8_MESS1|nr:hypothetical protein SAMD00020551_3578 [Mesobacillus selenatarsenatis SF-1]